MRFALQMGRQFEIKNALYWQWKTILVKSTVPHVDLLLAPQNSAIGNVCAALNALICHLQMVETEEKMAKNGDKTCRGN